MANRGEHGGKRKGAGRRPKWSHNFKLHIGMLCQTQFREAQKIAENRAIKELISEEDLQTEFQRSKIIPVPERSAWIKSEEGDDYIASVEAEIAMLNEIRGTGSETNRLFQINTRPPRGTRKSIRDQIALEYSLTDNQVKYIWDEYVKFERKIKSET